MKREHLDLSISLGQFLKDLPLDHPEKFFLERIGRQFGFDLVVSEEEQDLVLNNGSLHKAEIFRRLTNRNGIQPTHNSHYLLGPKASHWEGRRPSRKKKY